MPAMFPGHERKSATMVDAIAKRLALPNTTRDYVKLLVERHGDAMSYRAMMTPPAARRFLAKFPNSEVLGDLFALNRADIIGSGRPRHEKVRLVEEFESLVEHVMTEAPPLSRHDLAVSGYDPMKLGIPPTEQLGRIQNALLQEVLDDPKRNRKNYLLHRARALMRTPL